MEIIRDGKGYLSFQMVNRPLYATIKYQGNKFLVQRLIYQLIAKPDFEYRMTRLCPNELCVNPMHWEVNPILNREMAPKIEFSPMEEDEFPGMDWTQEDTEEMVDAILGDDPPPTCWDEVINHIDLMGAPEDWVRGALIRFNREDLMT